MKKSVLLASTASALFLAGGPTTTAVAQTAAPRTVTCASTAVFNTGADGAGGKLAVSNVADPSWGYATGSSSSYPPPSTTWGTPVTGQLSTSAWVWTDSNTVSPQAQWLTRDATLNGSPNNYYRYVFNLAANVDPAQLQVTTTYYADDGVTAIYVNGQAAPSLQPNAWATGSPRETVPGSTTLSGNWVAGTNEVIVAVGNSGNSPSGLLVNTAIANCASLAAPAQVPTMEVWGLASLAALMSLGASFGLARRSRRRSA